MPSVQDMFNNYGNLTNKQKLIFDYIMANPEDICYVSLRELSARVNASEMSVLRLCRALGFDSYVELKEAFRAHTQKLVRSVDMGAVTLEGRSSEDDDHINTLQEILTSEKVNITELLSGIEPDSLFLCARAILKAKKVSVFGHDVSKVLADYFVHRLNYLKINAESVRLGDNIAVQNAMTKLEKDDIVVFFSFPPYHLPIYNISRFAEYRGAQVLTISDSMRSPAVTEKGFTFLCGTGGKFFFNSLTTPISLISVLTACVAVEMGEKLDKILLDELTISRFISGSEVKGGEDEENSDD